ncbi:MAG: tetratricopeptide repeat protein, partial [Bacteroidota bacterium]
MRTLLIIAVFIFVGNQLKAQSVEFSAANFPNKLLELAQAQNDLNAGMKLFNMGVSRYKRALPLFEKANAFNPNNAMLNYNIAICYIYSSFRNKAKFFFEKAYDLDHNVTEDIHYWLGMSNHLANKWDKAREEYL